MIILMRHGEDDPTRLGGWSDAGLTREGRRQAKEAAVRLAAEYPGIRRIVSSDLPRARETAEIVGAEGVLTEVKPLMGSEDFADMLRVVPGAYAWVGHAGSVPVHNPAFVLDDGILPVGASLLARLVETRAAA